MAFRHELVDFADVVLIDDARHLYGDSRRAHDGGEIRDAARSHQALVGGWRERRKRDAGAIVVVEDVDFLERDNAVGVNRELRAAMQPLAQHHEQPRFMTIELWIANGPGEYDLRDPFAVDDLNEAIDPNGRIDAEVVAVERIGQLVADAPRAGPIARTSEQDVGKVIHRRIPRRLCARA